MGRTGRLHRGIGGPFRFERGSGRGRAYDPATPRARVWAPPKLEIPAMRSNLPRALALSLCVALLSLASTASVDAANTRGAKAPAIAISDGINGVTAKTKISDYKGSTTLLVLWLPVCPHCKKFMPTVPALQKKYAKKGLKILTITHGKVAWTRKFLADRKWTFGVGFDWTGVSSKRYGMKRMPGVYLIGADGYLRSYKGSLEAAIVAELNAGKKKTP